MNSTWKSLLWKEWREQRWRLMALSVLAVVLAFSVGVFFFYNINRVIDGVRFYIVLTTIAGTSYVVLAGTFVGMYVAGAENSHRTMRFLQALPTPMWKAAIIKLLMAIVSVIFPLLVMYACLDAILLLSCGGISNINVELLQSQDTPGSFEETIWKWLALRTAAGSLGLVSLLLWMSAAGMNRSDEIRAGAIGFLTCASAWLIFAIGITWANRYFPDLEKPLVFLMPVLPGGPGIVTAMSWDPDKQMARTALVLIAFLSHGAICLFYLKRYGHVAMTPKQSTGFDFNLLRRTGKTIAPMNSQWRAIAWKQLRETGPLAAIAVGGILVVVPIVYYFNRQGIAEVEFGNLLAMVSLSVGYFVILVAGIGVFMEDFAPGINSFWRSRPVNTDLWFAIKFVTGLTVLAIAFGGLLLLAYWLQSGAVANFNELFKMISFATFALLLLYTLALASYCLLRQPIYAAVMTFGLFLGGMLSIDWLFPDSDLEKSATIAMASAQLLATAIAWLAVKHDWGWKAGR